MAIDFALAVKRKCCVVWLVDGISYFASRSRLLSVLAPQAVV
jgi:hypothetical protein